MTPDERSLDNRLSIAIGSIEQAQRALSDVLDEPALNAKQRRFVNRNVGHLDGLTEALGLLRPR